MEINEEEILQNIAYLPCKHRRIPSRSLTFYLYSSNDELVHSFLNKTDLSDLYRKYTSIANLRLKSNKTDSISKIRI